MARKNLVLFLIGIFSFLLISSSGFADSSKLFIRLIKHDHFDRLVFDWLDPTGYELSQQGEMITIFFDRTTDMSSESFREKLPNTIQSIDFIDTDEGLGVILMLSDDVQARSFRFQTKIMIDVFSERKQDAMVPDEIEIKKKIENNISITPDNALRRNETLTISTSISGTGMAVFKRNGYLWIVSDEVISLDRLKTKLENTKDKIQRIPASSGTAFRLPLSPNLSTSVSKRKNNWILSIKSEEARPKTIIPVIAKTENDIFLKEDNLSRPITITDPEGGYKLYIIPAGTADHGVEGNRDFIAFDLNATSQGIVIIPQITGVTIRKEDDGVLVTRQDGLLLSLSSIAEDDMFNGKLFDLKKWQDIGKSETAISYAKQEQETLLKTAKTPLEERGNMRLKFAKLVFSHGFWDQAMAAMKAAAIDDTEIEKLPHYKSIRAASNFLARRYDESTEEFNELRAKYSGEELSLWLGGIAGETGQWEKALEYFQTADTIPSYYPAPYQVRFASIIAETFIKNGQIQPGLAFLKGLLAKKSNAEERYRFLKGKLHMLEKRPDDAIREWEGIENSKDKWIRAHSKFHLTNALLQQNRIKRPEAIKRLERQRFEWRGDELEFTMLTRLADLYLEEKNYRKGMDMLREAALNFPNHPETVNVTKKLTTLFKKLFLENEADNIKPLQALALFNDFRELIPVDDEGNKIVQNMAKRLINVELFDRAALLLEHQINYRLYGVERAAIGAKLAEVYLLSGEADKALSTLQVTYFIDLPKKVSQRRDLIIARAYIQKKNYKRALKTIRRNKSREAQILRVEMFWKTQDWKNAAKYLKILIGRPKKPLDNESRELIVNLAVALALSDNEKGLNQLHKTYSKHMKDGYLSSDFQALTSPKRELKDFNEFIKRYDTINKFEKFIEKYHDRTNKPMTQKEPEEKKEDKTT